jgi:hypothetical protein
MRSVPKTKIIKPSLHLAPSKAVTIPETVECGDKVTETAATETLSLAKARRVMLKRFLMGGLCANSRS